MARTARPGRRWVRWLRRGALALLGVVVLVVAFAISVAHSDWGRERARRIAEDKLDELFAGGGTIGKIEGSVFGEIVVRDLEIDGADHKPLLRVGELRLHVGLRGLLHHEVVIDDAIANDVTISVARDGDGAWSVAGLIKPTPSAGWSVKLLRGAANGRVEVDLGPGQQPVHVDDVAVLATADLPHGGTMRTTAVVSGAWRERGAAPIGVVVGASHDLRATDVDWLAGRVGGVGIAMAGVHVVVGGKSVGEVLEAANLIPEACIPPVSGVTNAALAACIPIPVGPPADPPSVTGFIAVGAPRAAVATLAPGLDLRADVTAFARAQMAGRDEAVAAIAVVGDGGLVSVHAIVDRSGRAAHGFASVDGVALALLDRDGKLARSSVARELPAKPSGFAMFDVAAPVGGRPGGQVFAQVWGESDAGPVVATIVARAEDDRVRASLGVAASSIVAHADASLRIDGEHVTLDEGSLVARTADLKHAAAVAPHGAPGSLRGALSIDVRAHGTLRPAMSLAVTGVVDGSHLRYADASVDSLHLAVDARDLPALRIGSLGSLHLALGGVHRGDLNLDSLALDATTYAGGSIDRTAPPVGGADRRAQVPAIVVALRTRPTNQPWLFDADAVIRPGDTTTVDLTRHHLRLEGVDWSGTTGHVEIGPRGVVVRNLATASDRGQLAIDGSYELGHLKLDARASAPEIGTARVVVDIDGPASPGDVAGWKQLRREALRQIDVTADADLGKLARLFDAPAVEALAGHVAAEVHVERGAVRGHVAVTDLRGLPGAAFTDAGKLGASLDLTGDAAGNVAVHAAATLPPSTTAPAKDAKDKDGKALPAKADGGSVGLDATARIPERLLDPAAWRALGRGAIGAVTLRTTELVVEPALLDRFHVTTPLRARVTASLAVEAGLRAAKLTFEVHHLRGGSLVEPVDLHAEATLDDHGSRVDVTAATAVTKRNPGAPVPLVQAHAEIATTLDQLAADPALVRALLATPVTGTVTLPSMSAQRLLAVFGRADVVAGTLDGTVTVAGTVGKPTVTGKLAAHGVEVPAGRGTTKQSTLETLAIDGSWDGTTAKLVADGKESGGGTLRVTATGAPKALAKATVAVEAKQFDLRPLTAFAPGLGGAIAGTLDGKLELTGVDPATATLTGKLTIHDARVPLAPTVGTLRSATVEIALQDRRATITIDGKLGKGTVKAHLEAPLSGDRGKATVELRNVSPIAAVQPVVNADISATVRRDGDHWQATVKVDHASVRVPDNRGHPLDPVGVPADFGYGTIASATPTAPTAPTPAPSDKKKKVAKSSVGPAPAPGSGGAPAPRAPVTVPPPAHPILVADIELGRTTVESKEIRTLIDGKLHVSVGGNAPGVPAIRIVGDIEAQRGDIELFGRRYQVDHAVAHFDGSTDPELDARLSFDFPEVTTITEVHGRMDKPEISLRSDPGTFSQSELLGFLLGGEPNGDPNQSQSAREKVAGAGTSYVANILGGYVRKTLPLDIDVVQYESATVTNSAAVTVGTWLTHELFLAYRYHLEARPDENTGEGEAEYWLVPHVSLQGTAGDRGYDGLDLLWRHRW